MRLWITFALAVAAFAEAPLTMTIPPVKTSVQVDGQAVEVKAWGTVSGAQASGFRLAVTADLADLQEHFTPILAAQLNRSERCGERMSVERAVLAPAAPSALLTAYVHYERFGCAKAFGKEIVRKLAGGNGVVEVNLTPAVSENRPAVSAQVRKIDADGSLGELLRSGSLGDTLKQKITTSIESAVQKSANLKSALPPELASLATLEKVQFADGGSGRLWLTLGGQVHLSAEQVSDLAKKLAH